MRNIQRRDRGYTVVELIIAAMSVLTLAGMGVGVYALCHFIAKWW